jgi:hypothetical protein
VSGDYLWDGSGEPDPEIQQLEEALRPLRSTRPPPQPDARRFRPSFSGWGALAAAAAVLLALAAVVTRKHSPATPIAPAGWELAWLEGVSWQQSHTVRETRLGVGEWIDTGGRRARLSIGEIGEARLEPSTRVGRLHAGERSHHLSLARGVLHAVIWAPPGQFLVDTPSARAVDLGCSYTLEVEEDGSGLLRVETGWVGFETRGLRSLVPAGAACSTRFGVGPGTPYYESAPEALRQALVEIDFGSAGPGRHAALERGLAAARERDALSLWHLLSRVEGEDLGRVFNRLEALVPPPDGVTREGILRGDQAQRDLWWDELGLGSADFWRDWTAPWHDPKAGRSLPAARAR